MKRSEHDTISLIPELAYYILKICLLQLFFCIVYSLFLLDQTHRRWCSFQLSSSVCWDQYPVNTSTNSTASCLCWKKANVAVNVGTLSGVALGFSRQGGWCGGKASRRGAAAPCPCKDGGLLEEWWSQIGVQNAPKFGFLLEKVWKVGGFVDKIWKIWASMKVSLNFRFLCLLWGQYQIFCRSGVGDHRTHWGSPTKFENFPERGSAFAFGGP